MISLLSCTIYSISVLSSLYWIYFSYISWSLVVFRLHLLRSMKFCLMYSRFVIFCFNSMHIYLVRIVPQSTHKFIRIWISNTTVFYQNYCQFQLSGFYSHNKKIREIKNAPAPELKFLEKDDKLMIFSRLTCTPSKLLHLFGRLFITNIT